MNRKIILKTISLCGSLITAVATIMIADSDKRELETKVFNDVMKNVNVMMNEGKEVI